MLTFGILVDAVLFVLAIVWCKQIFARFAADVSEVREGPSLDRNVILVFWVITLLVVVWVVTFVIGLL